MSALDFSSDSEEEAAHAPQPANKPFAAAAPLEASASEAALSATLVDAPEDLSRMTALQHRWTFWFMHRGNQKSGGNAGEVFEQALIPVANFQVVVPACTFAPQMRSDELLSLYPNSLARNICKCCSLLSVVHNEGT
jgi:hypothetical protein